MAIVTKREEDHEDSNNMEKNKIEEQPKGIAEIFRKWPKVTFFIIGNEFCERFSFYGMRSVLTIYLINYLHYNNNTATVLYHSFASLAYLTPLFGSMIADGYIGKFWTIFILSIVYAGGQVTLAIASSFGDKSPFHPWLDFAGLIVIAIGTGGIKPCVSSFGGDQFHKNYTRMISMFFSLFYFSINAGSTLSMFMTPLFRSIPCLGQASCYPLAFGVPAILMLVATGLFLIGSFWYKKVPPSENVIWRVIKTIQTALTNKAKGNDKRDHWLDYAMDEHECMTDTRCIQHSQICPEQSFVTDVKSLVRVLVMMIPFPMFWALYDQQGSRWTIQAMQMNSNLFGSVHLLPDQMQVLNAILILLMIPLFQIVVYPFVEKIGIRVTMLRKMASGGILCAISFIICALVQLAIEGTLVPRIGPNNAHLSFVNTYSNDSDSSCSFIPISENWPEKIIGTDKKIFDDKDDIIVLKDISPLPSISIRGNGKNCPVHVPLNIALSPLKTYSVLLTPSGYSLTESPIDKPKKGHGEIGLSIILDLPCSHLEQVAKWAQCNDYYRGDVAICKDDQCDFNKNKLNNGIWMGDNSVISPIIPYDGSESTRSIIRLSQQDIQPTKYTVYLIDRDNVTGTVSNQYKIPSVELNFDEMGSIYTAIISERGLSSLHRSIPPNTVSILWQIPQYIVLTAAEVLFSITGLEFAYSEAAPSLKSVVTALYLLTVAFGDFIIIAIAQINLFSSLVSEMIVFATAMLITMGVFILLSLYYYEYAHYDKDEDNEEERKDD